MRSGTTSSPQIDLISEHSRSFEAAGIDFAFQPIVNVHTGEAYGFEALLRGADQLGHGSIGDFFDALDRNDRLAEASHELLELAADRFLGLSVPASARFFYNVDNRLLDTPSGAWNVEQMIRALPRQMANKVFIEISEKHQFSEQANHWQLLNQCSTRGIGVALDDFGTGYSGLKLLYRVTPEIIKFDRFFIDKIDEDARKKLFIAKLVNMAHTMGIRVCAEGIETEPEFLTCREVGCDLAQGYFIDHPSLDRHAPRGEYSHVRTLVEQDRREAPASLEDLQRRLDRHRPVTAQTDLSTVLQRFRYDEGLQLVAVVNNANEPIGVIRERDLKRFVYSPFGISLLQAQEKRGQLERFISPMPVAELHTGFEEMLNLYSTDSGAEAIVITHNGQYLGVLHSRALLEVVNERQVAHARDQNPLTKLPGNTVINEYISRSLRPDHSLQMIAYIDFDHFKQFNDRFGFRLGDRAIMLFADILKELSHRESCFVGHIGGDDFFLGIDLSTRGYKYGLKLVRDLASRFGAAARNLHASVAHDERGTDLGPPTAADGQAAGEGRPQPLSLSSAVAFFELGTEPIDTDLVSEVIAHLKRRAKRGKLGISWRIVRGPAHAERLAERFRQY
jgi:EAL domain-containing protein (putative c-di-GMP-specific phosphodiesterase class I)/GGDEF domain-containing protein